MSFLDINIIREQGKFTTSVYHKPTFSGINTHFDSFLPFTYKIGMIHNLLYRFFWICSDWSRFHLQLVKLMDVFKTVPKKSFLVLAYLGPLSVQTRTKLRKYLKGTLNCCKFQIVFKSQNKLTNAFRFKDRIPKELTSGAVYKFHCGFYNELSCSECVTYLNLRIGEHIGTSPLTKRKVELKGSTVRDHVLLWNHLPSFEKFSVLTKENRMY